MAGFWAFVIYLLLICFLNRQILLEQLCTNIVSNFFNRIMFFSSCNYAHEKCSFLNKLFISIILNTWNQKFGWFVLKYSIQSVAFQSGLYTKMSICMFFSKYIQIGHNSTVQSSTFLVEVLVSCRE